MNYILFFTYAILGCCTGEDLNNTEPIKPFYQLPDYENNIFPRIVGGSVAPDNSFPHQVSLQFKNKCLCGGSIIDERHVLTAAHCLHYADFRPLPTSDMQILAGDARLESNNTLRQIITVSHIYIHEEYHCCFLDNDIGLIRMQLSLMFSSDEIILNVSPIRLQTSSMSDNTPCNVSGWGIQDENGTDMSPVLLFVENYVENHEQCCEVYGGYLKDTMICAGYQKGSRSACVGDSGGGLICTGALTGIVSFGYGCGRPESPTVYTEVRSYLRWIGQTIERTDVGNRPSDGPICEPCFSNGPTLFAGKSLLILVIVFVYNTYKIKLS